ncbi:MAG: type VI secretion system protein TssA [Caulobacteraceae bacterium]|nr:type VI secretion system protein TssA [Caulobacteraceae bacterium]
MALDLERLLAPVSDETPAGEDLAYDPERQEIEQAFEGSVSIDTTGEAASGPEVDWRRVTNLIEAQSARTKDVWLAVYLARAGARMGQLATVEMGLEYLAGLLEQFWDTVHPQLEEYGFQGRKGPCDSLTTIGDFLAPLDRVVLLEHQRLGRFTAADIKRFAAGADAEDDYGMFRAALAETSDAELVAALEAFGRIEGAVRRVDGVLTGKGEGGEATNFRPTYDAIAELKKAIAAFVTSPVAVETVEDAGEAVAADSGEAAAAGPRIGGQVQSREDVLKALDAIADYYRRREPASPVLLLLQRAREWVNLDFLAILQDIAPDSLDQARKVLNYQRSGE